MNMMTLIFIACFSLALSAHAQGTLRVTVTNIKKAEGSINIGLFIEEGKFLKEATVGKIVKAEKGQVTAVFENLPKGKYAASVIHDKNENGKLDTNFLGIPTEGFGFGNDAMNTFGPPSFEKASFEWDGKDKTITMKLKYM